MKTSKLKIKTAIKQIVQVFFSLGGLIYIFYKIPFRSIMEHWTKAAVPWIILILLCTIFSMIVQANRWKVLLVEFGTKIKFITFYNFIALGYFFNNILPSGFGGDAVKTIAFGRFFGNTENSVAAVAISRIMGLLSMFICFFIALPFVTQKYHIPLFYTAIVSSFFILSLLVILISLYSDKIKIPNKLTSKISFLLKLQNAFSIYRHKPKAFLFSSIDSIGLQISSIVIHYAYFKAVGISIDVFTITVFMTITITISMLPISINGIGIREGVNLSLFTGLLKIPADTVLAASLIGYIPLLFQAMQGAFVLIFLKKTKPKPQL